MSSLSVASSTPPTMPISNSRMTSSSAHRSRSSLASARFSSIGSSDASSMCDWKTGPRPSSFRRRLSSRIGRMKPSTRSGGQWSVCRETLTGYCSATTPANSARAMAPSAMFLFDCPEANSPPPYETWRIPSEPAWLRPSMAAKIVVEEVTLMAGRANPPLRAASSISRYFCGVGMGIWVVGPGWWVLSSVTGARE